MYYDKFKKLCDEKGVRPGTVSRATGIPSATFSEWKKGTYTPKQDKLKKVAEYFNISLEELMEEEPSEKKKTIIKVWHNPNSEEYAKEFVKKMSDSYLESFSTLLDTLPKLTEDQETLLACYGSLNKVNQEKLLRYASALLDTQQADEILEKVEEKGETDLNA